MRVIREVCVSGKVIDVTVKVPSGHHSDQRAPRREITPEKVQKNNEKLAAKKLTRIINANFDRNSSHDMLTYAGKTTPSPEEAVKLFDKFIRKLRREMQKHGLELKWVMSTEYATKRIHHHFITNAPTEMVEDLWQYGEVIRSPFLKDPNRYKLGEYIIKETSSTFRLKDCPFSCRYRHSRNLVMPKPQIEEVDARQLSDDPVAWKGYYIDPNTVRRYEHPITGLEHLEYMMISLDEKPRLKKYYKGKTKRREDNYQRYINHIEEQLSLLK